MWDSFFGQCGFFLISLVVLDIGVGLSVFLDVLFPNNNLSMAQ